MSEVATLVWCPSHVVALTKFAFMGPHVIWIIPESGFGYAVAELETVVFVDMPPNHSYPRSVHHFFFTFWEFRTNLEDLFDRYV